MFLAQIIKLLSSHCPSILGSRVHSSSSSCALAHISWNLVNRIIPGHWVCMIGWLTLYMYIFYRLHQGFAVQSTHSHSLLVCTLMQITLPQIEILIYIHIHMYIQISEKIHWNPMGQIKILFACWATLTSLFKLKQRTCCLLLFNENKRC